MSRPLGPALLLLAAGVTGCAASRLPYTPVQQPAGFRLAADYKVVGDRLRIEIDTGGHRVEDAQIVRSEGFGVAARAIEQPGPAGGGLGIGIGIESAGGSGSVGIGTGVGIGTTVPGGGRAKHAVAWFALDHVGPGPWRLRVKVVGVQPTDIVLPVPAR